MKNNLLISQKIDQRLTMTQQLAQAISLLQYTTLDLHQLIQQYAEKNPFIEINDLTEPSDMHANEQSAIESLGQDELITKLYTASKSKLHQHNVEDDTLYENYTRPKTLREHLLEQTLLCKFNHIEQLIAEAIIDAIEDNGYLSMSIEEIREHHHSLSLLPLQQFQDVLNIIHKFDPIGVAWRDRKDCLLLQLQNWPGIDHIHQICEILVKNHFDNIHTGLSKNTLRKLNISATDYANAVALILSLDPNPCRQFSHEYNFNIEPDLLVKKLRNKWQVELNEHTIPRIKISKQYQSLLKSQKAHQSYQTLTQELQEAQHLFTSVNKRNETLLKLGKFIVSSQKEYFDLGPSYMKPMTISNAAQALNVHESTISRIATGKYMATPSGICELRYFFSSHVTTASGENCSATAVKAHIKDLIKQENKQIPYSDSAISELLKQKGINVARRTVAKYREALKIPPVNLRTIKA